MTLQLASHGTDAVVSEKSFAEMDISAYVGSCQFLTTIVPLSIASVLNRRCNFDPEYIRNYSLKGVPYVGFRSNIPHGHNLARFLAMQPRMKTYIERKHLKEICVNILSRESDETVEKYVFKLTYKSGDGNFSRGRTAEVVASKFFNQINQLPKNNLADHEVKIIFNWQFYDTVPFDELALYFTSVKRKRSEERHKYVTLAAVKTRFHKLDVFVGLTNQDTEDSQENQDIPEQTPEHVSGSKEIPLPLTQSQNIMSDVLENLSDAFTPLTPTPVSSKRSSRRNMKSSKRKGSKNN